MEGKIPDELALFMCRVVGLELNISNVYIDYRATPLIVIVEQLRRISTFKITRKTLLWPKFTFKNIAPAPN